MTGTSVTKEFHRMLKRIDRLSDGQVTLSDFNWEDGSFEKFRVTVIPNAGFYKGGRFKFTVYLPEGLDSGEVPVIWCETAIYHPNIYFRIMKTSDWTSNVCLDLFEGDVWHPSNGIEGIIIGILFLLHNPNLQDPLSPEVDGHDVEEFAKNVKDYLATGKAAGVDYNTDFRVIDGQFFDLSEGIIEKDILSIKNIEGGNEVSVELSEEIKDSHVSCLTQSAEEDALIPDNMNESTEPYLCPDTSTDSSIISEQKACDRCSRSATAHHNIKCDTITCSSINTNISPGLASCESLVKDTCEGIDDNIKPVRFIWDAGDECEDFYFCTIDCDIKHEASEGIGHSAESITEADDSHKVNTHEKEMNETHIGHPDVANETEGVECDVLSPNNIDIRHNPETNSEFDLQETTYYPKHLPHQDDVEPTRPTITASEIFKTNQNVRWHDLMLSVFQSMLIIYSNML